MHKTLSDILDILQVVVVSNVPRCEILDFVIVHFDSQVLQPQSSMYVNEDIRRGIQGHCGVQVTYLFVLAHFLDSVCPGPLCG